MCTLKIGQCSHNGGGMGGVAIAVDNAWDNVQVRGPRDIPVACAVGCVMRMVPWWTHRIFGISQLGVYIVNAQQTRPPSPPFTNLHQVISRLLGHDSDTADRVLSSLVSRDSEGDLRIATMREWACGG